MKTAEQILLQNLKFRIGEIDESLMPKIILAMKEYANHKLDEAADRADLIDDCVDRKTIFSLKDKYYEN